MTALIILALVALLVLGAPIFAVMLGFALLGALVTGRGMADFAVDRMFATGLEREALILATIPLFIFCGYLMAESKTADRMVRFAKAALGWLPGGLAVVTIIACAVFTTFSGASGVTIVALGGLVMPALVKEMYPKRFSLGLVAGTGSVGLLFPPALPLIVFGTVYGVSAQSMAAAAGSGDMELIEFSIQRFLFAGIVPGLVLVGILCVMAIAVAIVRKVPRQAFNAKELAESAAAGLPEMALPLLIIGGLANGVQVSEIAALTAVYVLVLELGVFKDVRLAQLGKITRESMVLVGAIFMIILAASVLTGYFTTEGIPNKVMAWITAHVDSKWVFLLALNIVLIFVGMVMDIFSAIVVVVPLIIPVADRFGIDPYHLGVIFLLNLEVGYLTPPVGLNLFITSFKFNRPITEVMRASLPFLGAMVLALALVTYIPGLTVVPGPERDGEISDLVDDVRKARERAGMVTEVELPSGETLSLDDCDKIPDSVEALACQGLFKKVSACRAEAGGEPGSPCEEEAISTYAGDDPGDSGADGDFDLDDELDDIDLDDEIDETLDDELSDDLDSELEDLDEEPSAPSPSGDGPDEPEDDLDAELDEALDDL